MLPKKSLMPSRSASGSVNREPASSVFIRPNNQKSDGAISGLSSGWGTRRRSFSVKNFSATVEKWTRQLSRGTLRRRTCALLPPGKIWLLGKVELNECWSIWVIGKVTIQQRPWKDWTSFKSHCRPIHHILSTSHLLISSLLVGARTQCEVTDSKRKKLFECLSWISASIWIPARISQCTTNGSQNVNNASAWFGELVITMSLK
jgi:hypothetical protein